MAIYSRSSIHNTNYRRFWIWKKTNALLNLINNQPDIDKIYLYAKDPYEAKYEHLIKKLEKVGIDHFNDPNAFIVLIVFDDLIADMINNKKLNSVVTELFIRGRKMLD